MTEQDRTQLIVDIITKAQEGKSQPFRPILYWSEFSYYKKLARATKLIIKTLKISSNNLFKEYCLDVVNGTSDINKLLAYSQLLDILYFYTEELKTIKKMIKDYDDYLDNGNFWHSFFGGRREL